VTPVSREFTAPKRMIGGEGGDEKAIIPSFRKRTQRTEPVVLQGFIIDTHIPQQRTLTKKTRPWEEEKT